jgi:hypothetical protein
MGRLLSIAALLVGLSDAAFGQTSPASEIAPGGTLRGGMIAITVLWGVAEPVARFVGQKLGAAVEPVMYPNPEAYLESFGKNEWDIAIGPPVLAPARLFLGSGFAFGLGNQAHRQCPMPDLCDLWLVARLALCLLPGCLYAVELWLGVAHRLRQHCAELVLGLRWLARVSLLGCRHPQKLPTAALY